MTEKRLGAKTYTFAQAEQEFARLKDQFEGGKLTEADLKAQMQDLMVQDAKSQWWVIGYETGQWYVHVGEEWVQRDPPGASRAVPVVESAAKKERTLWETLWWPALLMSMGFAFSVQVSSSISRPLFDCGCWGGSGGWEYFRCLVHNCGTVPAAFSAFFFGIVTGLVGALIIKSVYATLTWKHVAIVAGGWGVLFGLGTFLD